MLRVTNNDFIKEMGFTRVDCDYIYYGMVDDVKKALFTIYAGSPYIRFSKTNYVANIQVKCICEWVKKGYVEWVEVDE